MGGLSNINSLDYTSLEIVSGTNARPLQVDYKRGLEIIKSIIIDSYDGDGNPVFYGTTLVGQKLNVAEGKFVTSIDATITNVSDTVSNLLRVNGDMRMMAFFDSRITEVPLQGETILINEIERDLNDSGRDNWLNVATATTLNFVSTSAQETAFVGTGLWGLAIQGLDNNLDQITDVIFLTGTVPTNTNLSFRAVNLVVPILGGTPGSGAVGNITFRSNADSSIWGGIRATKLSSVLGRYTVPNGYRAFYITAQLNAGDGSDTTITTMAQLPPPGDFPLSIGELYIGGGVINQIGPSGFAQGLAGGTTFKFRGFSNSSNPDQRRATAILTVNIAREEVWAEYYFNGV